MKKRLGAQPRILEYAVFGMFERVRGQWGFSKFFRWDCVFCCCLSLPSDLLSRISMEVFGICLYFTS